MGVKGQISHAEEFQIIYIEGASSRRQRNTAPSFRVRGTWNPAGPREVFAEWTPRLRSSPCLFVYRTTLAKESI